jgi:Ca-activated chloride channel family protein
MRLVHPEMAVWLLAVPVVTGCWFLHYQYKWRRRGRVETVPTVAALSRRSAPRHDVAVLVLAVLTVALLAGAMVRPQVLLALRTPELERQDLILVLDRSASMRARDIRPSRLGRAIEEIKTFLQRKPDAIDRVGLIGFAGTSVPLAYPTRDLDSIFFYLDWALDDPTPMYGTNIGAALTSALAVARRDRQEGVPPLFVVISDGEDEGEELEQAVERFRRENLRVHAIGIGSHDSVPIPVAADDGTEEFLQDDGGQVLTTEFDETTLQTLSGSTGGRYFRSVTGGELRAALDTAVVADRRRIGWTTVREYRDIYLFLLAAAAVSTVGLVARL